MKKYFLFICIISLLFAFTGCLDNNGDDDDTTDAAASNASNLPFSLSEVTWLYPDVSAWPETGTMSRVEVVGDTIFLEYDKTNEWPNTNGLNANVWIFIEKDGTWYAATFEYMRQGYTWRGRNTVAGDHIKREQFNGWRPASGTQYGFMASGLVRGGLSNVQERTNVYMYTWP